MRVFADTSALVALRDAGDANHEAALAWMRGAQERRPKLVLTPYVVAEVHGFFCRAPKVALAYAERIRQDPTFQLVRPSAADENEAWALLASSQDKTYSFVDAVSFAVMRRLRIPQAFAFDDHFRQVGRFEVVPG